MCSKALVTKAYWQILPTKQERSGSHGTKLFRERLSTAAFDSHVSLPVQLNPKPVLLAATALVLALETRAQQCLYPHMRAGRLRTTPLNQVALYQLLVLIYTPLHAVKTGGCGPGGAVPTMAVVEWNGS